MEIKNLYFGRPNKTGKFHIFSKEKKSLCGRWGMPFFNPDKDDFLKGSEVLLNGDCKTCYNKAYPKNHN